MSKKNRAKEYYINNKDIILNRAKEYYINNKKSIREDLLSFFNMTDEEGQKKKEYQKE